MAENRFFGDNDRLEAAHEDRQVSKAALNEVYLKLCGTGHAILDRLRTGTASLERIAIDLEKMNRPWSIIASQRLRRGIEQAKIKRDDREAKILLSLPNETNQDIAEWLQNLHIVDANSDWLIAATRYGSARLRALSSTADSVASELVAAGEEDARVVSEELRSLAF